MLIKETNITDEKLKELRAQFTIQSNKILENLLEEFIDIPIYQKLDIIQIVLEKMWFTFLRVNFKDPINLARAYLSIQNMLKSNKFEALDFFINAIEDKSFKEEFISALGKLQGIDVSQFEATSQPSFN